MSTAMARRDHADATDPLHLRVVYEVLTGLVDDLDTAAKVTVADLRARLVSRRQLVHEQLNDAVPVARNRRPVVLDPARPIRGLADSKQLAEAVRERLAKRIRTRALAWASRSHR